MFLLHRHYGASHQSASERSKSSNLTGPTRIFGGDLFDANPCRTHVPGGAQPLVAADRDLDRKARRRPDGPGGVQPSVAASRLVWSHGTAAQPRWPYCDKSIQRQACQTHAQTEQRRLEWPFLPPSSPAPAFAISSLWCPCSENADEGAACLDKARSISGSATQESHALANVAL